VLRTLPKKGESLTTVCAAEAEPTYEKTGAGALVDILSLRAHRSHFTAPEFRICAFRPFFDLPGLRILGGQGMVVTPSPHQPHTLPRVPAHCTTR